MSKSITNLFFIGMLALFTLLVFAQNDLNLQQQSTAQVNNPTESNNTFYSAKDLYVTTDPEGYGMYQERGSNVFQPGETMVLYIEPVGFKYNNLTDDQGKPLYSINFDASFTIYDKDGNVLLGPVNAPIPPIVSHYKNKEVFIPFTITQSSPFPPGEYSIKYSIMDENSGNVFELDKNITIFGGNGTNSSSSSSPIT
jgi:hypothetical protein